MPCVDDAPTSETQGFLLQKGENMSESIALNIDCMEYMATLPDKSFDLAIVDPPYGLERYKATDGGNSKKDGATGGQSDEASSFTPAPSGFVPADVDSGELPF